MACFPLQDSRHSVVSDENMSSSQDNYEIRLATVTIGHRDEFLQTLRTVGKRNTTSIICFDAEKMAGPDHVETAIQHAQRSFFSEKPISNSFEMEALLFAAGSRQCSAATLFGIHSGVNILFVCICPPKDKVWAELTPHMHFVADIGDTWTKEKATRLMKLFDISQNEVDLVGEDRLKELVLERIALLKVYR